MSVLSRIGNTVAVFATMSLAWWPLLGQPAASDLTIKQPIAFQTARPGPSTASDTAFELTGIDHRVLLSGVGNLTLQLPGYGATGALQLSLVGVATPKVSLEGRLSTTAFEFLGNDPAKWTTGIPLYGTLRYTNVYPNIDLVYHDDGTGHLEFDFAPRPGSDPKAIDSHSPRRRHSPKPPQV